MGDIMRCPRCKQMAEVHMAGHFMNHQDGLWRPCIDPISPAGRHAQKLLDEQSREKSEDNEQKDFSGYSRMGFSTQDRHGFDR